MRFNTLTFLLCLHALPGHAQEGYAPLADRIEIGSKDEWAAWQAPVGTRVFGEDGSVQPRFVRRDINAALNADRFIYVSEGDTLVGGIAGAGSGIETAHWAIDGNNETYWEPNLSHPVEDWWVDIDLGRVALVTRVVVRFAEEGAGDPLLKFRVLASDGRVTFTYERQRSFRRVGLANLANKTQREFVFDIEPPARTPEGVEGVAAQIIRIQTLDSDGPRGAPVDSTTYGALSEEERGAVDYFRRTVADRQIPVARSVYEALPPEEQGDIRYYRHERPRLAEVEVYAIGDNAIRLTRPPLGEQGRDAATRSQRPYTDGLFSTFGNLQEYDAQRDERQVVIDLGASYWLDRIRLLSPAEPPPAYQLRVSDGALNADGERIWRFFDEQLNRESFLQLEERFDLRPVRYIDLRRLPLPAARSERGKISEIQAYGEGFVPEVVMHSPLMKLPSPKLFTHLSWTGDIPNSTQIAVRTRTGNELEEILHYYSDRGNEISRIAWERRAEDRRGPIVLEELPGTDWSGWSPFYFSSGQAFQSPAPRRYALAEVRLRSDDPQLAATLRSLRLHFAPPIVDEAVAELWPLRQIQPGVKEEFTLYVRPTFGANNPGFDRLRLGSSSVAPIELVDVRSGSESLLHLGGGRQLWPGPVRVERNEEEEINLLFTEPVQRGTLYAIRLRTEVYMGNTQFFAALSNSQWPDRLQQISPGNATDLVASQSLVAVTDLGDNALLSDVVIAPVICTPNGDGVNDRIDISAKVFSIQEGGQLHIELFDLSGRRLRSLGRERARASGEYSLHWDGLDENGQLVAPGSYLIRIRLEVDAKNRERDVVRLIQVAY